MCESESVHVPGGVSVDDSDRVRDSSYCGGEDSDGDSDAGDSENGVGDQGSSNCDGGNAVLVDTDRADGEALGVRERHPPAWLRDFMCC